MNNWLKMMALSLFAAIAFCGCSNEEPIVSPYLEVTPNNISGSWVLVSYQQGLTLAEGSYVYVDFERKDRTYALYQNTDSFLARCITGSYNVITDPELGAVIIGNYDYDNGDWAHRYVVKELTKERMVWVATDDATDVSVYKRAEIPAEILAANSEQ